METSTGSDVNQARSRIDIHCVICIQQGHVSKAWGILTWRGSPPCSCWLILACLYITICVWSVGVTEDRAREITGIRKREWKYIPQPDLLPFMKPKQSASADKQTTPDSNSSSANSAGNNNSDAGTSEAGAALKTDQQPPSAANAASTTA
jgi:hypothetical protein